MTILAMLREDRQDIALECDTPLGYIRSPSDVGERNYRRQYRHSNGEA